MMLSDVAVRRPVFAAVAAIVLCVIGGAAFFFLPVRELPDVDPPVVSINTTYAGASAEVIESRITEPVEQQIAGIQGVDRITSASRDGRSSVTIEFSLDRNIDDAANDVRDRVARVVGRLPDQADPPEVSKADSDASPIMILFLRSSSMNRLELTDYADRYLLDRLATVPGVAQAQIFGEQRYAMRIWLNAEAMAARGITVTQVENALNAQNVELPAGSLESTDKDYTVRVARTYARAEDFAQLPIGTAGSAPTAVGNANGNNVQPSTSGAVGAIQGANRYVSRLGDIARVEEAPAEARRLFRGNGLDQIGLGVTRQAQSNDLAISEGIRSALVDMQSSLPPGTELVVGSDNSVFTSHAISEVWITIGISLALVALVNFIFLGSLRAALIPSVVAPICLLATFIVLAPLGFSLNLLTLLALVLAIGLVVDDAIVVTENIQRRLDLGEPPLVAAERGARQVFFAVVATTVVLLAVFAPLLFLPGYVGRLFVELAAAIAAAVAFSAFLALTLSPMLASKILKPASGSGWVARRVDKAMDVLKDSYGASLGMLVGSRVAVIGVAIMILVVAGGAVGMFLVLPSELVPQEDRGRVQVRVQGPEGAGFDYTRKIMLGLEPILAQYKADGEVESYLISAPGFGGGSFNSGNATLILKDWSERKRAADVIAQEINGKLRGQTGAQVNASIPGAFQRGGGGGGGNSNSVEMVVTGSEYEDIYRWLQPVLAASLENPGFSRPRLNYEPNSPRLLVDVDPEKSAALGVSSQEIGRTLETMFGSRRATTYIKGGQEYDVILQTERANRAGVADLENLYVSTGGGTLVPLASVVETQTSGDTPDRRRLDRQRAISLQADLNPGETIADAVAFLNAEVAKQPQGIVAIQWGGAARDQQEAGSAVGAAFGLALLLVFLVLAAQFESWITPAVIMLTVPLAAAGGLFGLLMAGSSLNIYSQIGLIILIGVAAKNGILIVEFANQLRDQGRSIREAIIESSTLRLRPIIMTSIATAFGALPLVLWHGAGAGSRQTIGVVIFTGAMFSTLLTLFVVPVIYGALARFTKSPEWTARKIEQWEAQESTANDPVPHAAE